MKKYVDNFMQYRFLLSELVKKGIKLKYRQDISGVYSDRTIVVQLLFTGNKGGIEIYQTEFGDDQESLCAEILVSVVQRAF